MAKGTRGLQVRRHGTISPVLRPMVWSAMLSAVVSAVLATPAYADPPLPNVVPDTGARPVATGPVRLPGQPAVPGTGPTVPALPAVNGPLAAQIYAQETELAILGEQLLTLRQNHTAAQAALLVAQRDRDLAAVALAEAQKVAEAAAAEAIKEAAALPPGTFGSDLHELGALSRLQRGRQTAADTSGPAWELSRAQDAANAANERFLTASAQAQTATTTFTTAELTYRQKTTALLALKRQNADQLAAIERAQEAAEQRLGGTIGNGGVAGKAAHPRAMAAVRYAIAQLGDPYLWAAEGPDRFDCSGLMWAAYRSKGADYFDLPRVSRDQYYATRGQTVDRGALLPGDLLFFASGDSWTTIHHVGMYIGNGKMVHAPTTGDVVKISTVWWSRFYAATRVFGAVPAPTTPSPTPTPSPKPTKPPTSPSPTTPPPTTKPPAPPVSPKPAPTTPSPIPTPAETTTAPSPDPTTDSPSPDASSLEPSTTTSEQSASSSASTTG